MNGDQLQEHVAQAARDLEVPGVAVGVYRAAEVHYATHGMTNVEHPLPVDERTLFAIGSIGKTYTATAIMRLVDKGRIDLHERVRRYLPELRLQDERVAEEVTVLHLLNHTAGWEGDRMIDTGEGDDALARYAETLADLPQLAPLGGEPTYNNAALRVAGRVIEKVTGRTFEQAIAELLLEPLGLGHTQLELKHIMTRRFAVGHHQHPDGTTTVYRPYGFVRNEVPAGGRVASSVADQIAWARFHLGDGRAADGTRVLPHDLLRRMREATGGRAPDDRIGIVWSLRELAGVELVEHDGASPGQYSALTLAPEQDFALSVLVNSGPNGQELRNDLVPWLLEAYLGIRERIPEPLDAADGQLAPYVGTYGTDMALVHVAVAPNRLTFTTELQPEYAEQARAAGDDQIPLPPPFRVGLLPEDGFVIVDGPFKGEQGRFVRQDSGTVGALHMGRLMPRVGLDGEDVVGRDKG
jgi:CubicO group peptidase (beta-lactamase class C family)